MTPRPLVSGLIVALACGCVDLTDSDEKSPKDAGKGGDASQLGDGAFPTGGKSGAGGSGGSSGSGGVAGAPVGGSGGTTTGPVWKLYSRSEFQASQWAVAPLNAAWSGANAPPLSGIEAAVQLTRFDRLIVFDDQGNVFVRANKSWIPPRKVSQAFAAWTAGQVLSASHEESAPNAPVPEDLVVLIGPGGRACLYDFVQTDDSFQYKTCVDLLDGDGGVEPPRQSVPIAWSVEIWNDGSFGTTAFLQEFTQYGDYVYLFDATPAFVSKWLVQDSPLWKNTTNAPPVTGIKAGFFDPGPRIVYLIGP